MGESVEDDRLLFGRDANPRVADTEMEVNLGVGSGLLRDPGNHLASIGEFQGISYQVHQYLAQPIGITDKYAGDFVGHFVE